MRADLCYSCTFRLLCTEGEQRRCERGVVKIKVSKAGSLDYFSYAMLAKEEDEGKASEIVYFVSYGRLLIRSRGQMSQNIRVYNEFWPGEDLCILQRDI